MVDFYTEPERCCHKDPIGELDLKVNQYYSSVYSRLYKHVNDTAVHITQKERDEWNNKASKEALKDIQDQLDEITGDESGSIKYEILLEVTRQIADAIDGLNLGDYAKKKYVDDAIRNINLDGYITKNYADSTYLKIVDYTKFDANSYYTKAEIQNMLKNSDIVKDYSIESFAIENNKLVLVQKNGGRFEVSLDKDETGCVDTNYIQDQLKNYIKKGTLSKLNINGIIHTLEDGDTITIPVGGSGTSVDPTKFGYNKSYFKSHNSNEIGPEKPTDNMPPEDGSGWLEDAPNPKKGYYIWMTQVFINGNGQYGSYINPICLTGAKGEDGSGGGSAGEDGSGVNFIYKTAIDGEVVNSPGNVSLVDGVPVVPSGWNNHPQGVTKDIPYEYCSVVISTKGQWESQWGQPFVWSHFGQNGMDGDGVEYIYYASTIAPTTNLPSSWTNDEGFQNREYIKENSGWTDDPIDLEVKGPGYKQYVCTRKKYADTSGGDPYWHAYSSPALWGNYARDGVTGGLILDVTGEIKYLYKYGDHNETYHGESTITMYNDGSPIQFSVTIDSVESSSGSGLGSNEIETYFDIVNSGDSKTLLINIPENKLSFADGAYYVINITGTTDTTSQQRTAQIYLYGIQQGGQNGVAYDLKVSASAINKQDGALYPESVNVKVIKSDGPDITEIEPDNYDGWIFKYSVDNGDSYSPIDRNPVYTEGDNGMLFTATDGTITLSEFVPIVKSSAVAGLSGVSYSLQLSNLQLSYQPQGREYSLSISGDVKLYRIEAGGSSTELSNDSANIKYQLGSGSKTELTYQSGSWNLNINTTVSSKSEVITLYASNTNGAHLTSMSVPVSSSGEKGDKGDPGSGSTGQTLNGSPLRMAGEWERGKTYYDGKRNTENGIFCQDVVLYNKMYYACINADSGINDNWNTSPDTATYWQKFTVTEDIVTDKILANQAYIEELSSKEVVIMDGNRIVAGMTSSKALEHSSLNNVTKGSVRIWAGEMQNAGDLTSAPFTVTSKGELKSTKANITGQINAISGSIGILKIENGGLKVGEQDNLGLHTGIEIGKSTFWNGYSSTGYRQVCIGKAASEDPFANNNPQRIYNMYGEIGFVNVNHAAMLVRKLSKGTSIGSSIDFSNPVNDPSYAALHVDTDEGIGIRSIGGNLLGSIAQSLIKTYSIQDRQQIAIDNNRVGIIVMINEADANVKLPRNPIEGQMLIVIQTNGKVVFDPVESNRYIQCCNKLYNNSSNKFFSNTKGQFNIFIWDGQAWQLQYISH